MITELYYHLKPILPRSIQLFLRKKRISYILHKFRDCWPIDPTAAAAPARWKGWPDGKQFAVVLTHDVDTSAGKHKCLDLMRLEQDMGVRSTFYFVPEGYEQDKQVHTKLKDNGFEIGVHGLLHDGKLFRSKSQFMKRAAKINQYIDQWQATGFRSPCMHHNLSWISNLNVMHDASTYDFDPFEPQGGGMHTIFPFIVNDSASKRSYVELPYTLPQDFLLYVLMQKRSIDIWQRKLDFVAQNGGMVMLITHPDYMNFNGGPLGSEEYPADYYAELLQYLKTNYANKYWLTTAEGMAVFWKENMQNTFSDLLVQRDDSKHQVCRNCKNVEADF